MDDQPIRLAEVDKGNFWAVAELSVADHQREFVATNAMSIAQSKYWTSFRVRAI